jgi:hypothetical protein
VVGLDDLGQLVVDTGGGEVRHLGAAEVTRVLPESEQNV